jgi:hypothetical protein
MKHKELSLRAEDLNSAINELKFELATARAESVELLIIKYSDSETYSHFTRRASCVLRKIKQRRVIQLYAFAENFLRGGTESVYLKNKYPELFTKTVPTEGDRIVYIKL